MFDIRHIIFIFIYLGNLSPNTFLQLENQLCCSVRCYIFCEWQGVGNTVPVDERSAKLTIIAIRSNYF